MAVNLKVASGLDVSTGTNVSNMQIIQPAAGQERTQKFSPNCVTARTTAKKTARWEFPRESRYQRQRGALP